MISTLLQTSTEHIKYSYLPTSENLNADLLLLLLQWQDFLHQHHLNLFKKKDRKENMTSSYTEKCFHRIYIVQTLERK